MKARKIFTKSRKKEKKRKKYVKKFQTTNKTYPWGTPSKLTMWKQIIPLYIDKISIMEAGGEILGKRDPKVTVIFWVQNFHRLSVARNIHARRTSSRKATPLGDGRGVPKYFRDFGRFSSCRFLLSPPLLEGFALRSKVSIRVPTSYNSRRCSSISLLKKSNHTIIALIFVDLNKMDPSDPTPATDLTELIESMDFELSAGYPEMSNEVLQMFFQQLEKFPNETTTTSVMNPPPINISTFPSSVDVPSPRLPSHPAPVLSLPGESNTTDHTRNILSIPASTSDTAFNLFPNGSSNIPFIILPQNSAYPTLNLRQIEVPEAPPLFAQPLSPEDQGYTSSPSSPLSSSSSSAHTGGSSSSAASSSSSVQAGESSSSEASSLSLHIGESAEETRLRLRREACQRYRRNRKRRREEESTELDQLERRNRQLKMQVESMESQKMFLMERIRERNRLMFPGKRK